MGTNLINLQKVQLPLSCYKRDLNFNNEVISLSKNSQEWLKSSYKTNITKPLQRHNDILPFSPQNIPSFHAFTNQNTLICIANSYNFNPKIPWYLIQKWNKYPQINGYKYMLIQKYMAIQKYVTFPKYMVN